MSDHPVLRKIDAVTVPVPDRDDGLRFYVLVLVDLSKSRYPVP